jgi:hypothetical protein
MRLFMTLTVHLDPFSVRMLLPLPLFLALPFLADKLSNIVVDDVAREDRRLMQATRVRHCGTPSMALGTQGRAPDAGNTR